MIVLTPSTAAVVALHAATNSWIVFMQNTASGPFDGYIKIEGIPGSQLATRLTAIARDNPYDVNLIGLIATTLPPADHAAAIGAEHDHIRDGWYKTTPSLLAFIQHVAQDAIRMLLGSTQPGGLDGEDVVDIDELASILGVSVPTIRRWIKTDAIPYLKLGRIYRFVPSDVIASLQHA